MPDTTPDTYDPPHFWGCHLQDAFAPPGAPSTAPEPEECWHCGTTTVMNECPCTQCQDTAGIVGGVYHCPTCGRWWGYVTVTRLDIGEAPGE